MAHEITPWKSSDCSVTLDARKLSNRQSHSSEINETYGEGGGLNANYRTVEAVAVAANALGRRGLIYGTHFVFKTGNDEISFDFLDGTTRDEAQAALQIVFGDVVLQTA